MTQDQLYRSLYMAARANLVSSARDDSDAVKACRDQVTFEMYNKFYEDLTHDELIKCIQVLNKSAKRWFATEDQQRALKFYSIACALVYAPFDDITFTDHETGIIYEGEEAREAAMYAFDFKDETGRSLTLPKALFTHLYESWINRHSNKLLIQAGFRKYCTKPNIMYYHQLQKDEMDHLIKYYQQMYLQIKQRIIVTREFNHN